MRNLSSAHVRRCDWRRTLGVGVATAASSATSVLPAATALRAILLVFLAVVEAGKVDPSGILGQPVGVLLHLMRLEIHGRIKDYELLLQTFCVVARIVVVVEMGLESIVIEEIARIVGIGDSITQMATLVSVAAVGVKLITSVESLSAEAALWVTLETGLLRRTGCVVASPLVLPQLLWCE